MCFHTLKYRFSIRLQRFFLFIGQLQNNLRQTMGKVKRHHRRRLFAGTSVCAVRYGIHQIIRSGTLLLIIQHQRIKIFIDVFYIRIICFERNFLPIRRKHQRFIGFKGGKLLLILAGVRNIIGECHQILRPCSVHISTYTVSLSPASAIGRDTGLVFSDISGEHHAVAVR